MARPVEYTPEHVTKTKEYLALCQDEVMEYHKTRGEKSDSFERIINVKIPTIEGLAAHLEIAKSTLYLWKEKYQEFSDVIEQLLSIQASRLVDNGLSGNYNPTIAKVLLTKHGYREGTDMTSNDKQLAINITSETAERYGLHATRDPKDSSTG
jgi:hypothetical protein